MLQADKRSKHLQDCAQRIIPEKVRDLFHGFCREILLFSDDISVEIRPFELRFLSPDGFTVVVSPYREIFLASIGSDSPCEVRIAAVDGYCNALDLALCHFLEVRSRSIVGKENA